MQLLGILVGLTLFAEMLGEQKGLWKKRGGVGGSQEEPEQEWDPLACCCVCVWGGGAPYLSVLLNWSAPTSSAEGDDRLQDGRPR